MHIYLIVNYVRIVKVTQSYLTLCDPINHSLPGSSIHRILQTRILEWVAVPFSRGSSQPRDQSQVSHIAVDSLSTESPGKPFLRTYVIRLGPLGNPGLYLCLKIHNLHESTEFPFAMTGSTVTCSWIRMRTYLGLLFYLSHLSVHYNHYLWIRI